MNETFIGVFISVFFIFGMYCAACELGRLFLRVLRAVRKKKSKIDTKDKKDYNKD